MVTLNIDISKETKQLENIQNQYESENKPAEITLQLGKGLDPTIEGEVRDLVGQWYLNSRVLDGRFFNRLKELASYLSKKLGFEVTEDDIVYYRKDMQKFVQKNLSDIDKVELIQEQLSLVLQQSHSDRGKAVALQDTLHTALLDLLENTDDVASVLTSYRGKSLLTNLQVQQKLSQDSNEKILDILEKMVGFGTTKDSTESLNSILNASNKNNKPLNNQDILKMLESSDIDPLPQEAKQVSLTYDQFINGETNERTTTVTVNSEIQSREQSDTKHNNNNIQEVEFDTDFPD